DARLRSKDEPIVLPVELQMVGWTYETIREGHFSAADLRHRGGKAGLYRDYIEDAKDYARSKTGVPGATSGLVLLRLIRPAGTKWPQSVRDIASGSLGLAPQQVDDVLRAFAERFLVRRLPDGDAGAGADALAARRYELMHEHLVQLLAEAPDPEVQRANDA